MATKRRTMPPPMSKEILEILKLKGWTQKQLADELGVHEATVFYWVDGGRKPGGPARKLIVQALERARAESRRQPA